MHFGKTSVYFTILCLAFSLSVHAQSDPQNTGASTMTPAEQSAAAELFQAANEDRAPNNLQSLHNDPDLTKAAWLHAQRMVQSGTLSHKLPGEPGLIVRVQQAGVHCSTVSENVAEGPTAGKINDEWMHSASHRANLLDPRVNAVGIAIVKQDGKLFAVQDFAREMTALTPQQQEQQVSSLLSSHGLQVQPDGTSARGYCNGASRQARPLPKLVMKYSTTDLSHLPQQVEQGIASGSYHRAVVGACAAANQNGFAAYQMVILLY